MILDQCFSILDLVSLDWKSERKAIVAHSCRVMAKAKNFDEQIVGLMHEVYGGSSYARLLFSCDVSEASLWKPVLDLFATPPFEIKKRVSEYKEVEGAYDLIIHDYGPSKKMGSIHIQVNDNMTAKEIHKLTRDIQLKLLSEFGIVMTIGIYASNDSDKEAVKIKKELDDIIEEYPEIIQLHGFYIDDETKTIMFDLIISFSCKDRNALRDQVVERIKKEFPKYNYMAIIDFEER